MFGRKLISVYFILFSFSCAELDDTTSDPNFFTYPIHDLSHPRIKELIRRNSHSLAEFSFFYIPKFHTKENLHLLKDQALNECFSRGVRHDQRRSIFGDRPDLEQYLDDHPRNKLGEQRITLVEKNDLSRRMIELYEYNPLLNFLGAILRDTKYDDVAYVNELKTWEEINLVDDEASSVYLKIGINGDKDEWHFDQYPFSCIHMLSKPEFGGRTHIAFKPPLSRVDGTEGFLWDWDFIEAIQRNDFEKVHYQSIELKEGDLLCLNGNITLQATETITGPVSSISLVMGYADVPNFKPKKLQGLQINQETKIRHKEL